MSPVLAWILAPAQMGDSPRACLAAYLDLRISKEQINGLKLHQNWPQCQILMAAS
jgi:hypothetical protein